MVYDFLGSPDAGISPRCGDSIFKVVLLGVELDCKERVLLGLSSCNKLYAFGVAARGHQVPKLLQGINFIKGLFKHAVGVVIEEDTLSSSHCTVFFFTESLHQSTVAVVHLQGFHHRVLVLDGGEDCGIVDVAAGNIHDGLEAQASGPNRVWVPLLVLLLGVLDDEVNIAGPMVGEIDLLVATSEEHAVDLTQHLLQLSFRVVEKQGDDLGTSHLQVLDVG